MSNRNKPRLSLGGATEKTMEANPNPGPTAKEQAAIEEANALAAKRSIAAQQVEAAAHDAEPVSIIGLAAQGREVLLDQLRQHAERSKKPEYVPPPMTERQLSQRELELEAGRKAQARAQAQWDSRPVPPKNPNEGFTTPVHRPGDVVPDPILTAGASAAGTRQFGSDA